MALVFPVPDAIFFTYRFSFRPRTHSTMCEPKRTDQSPRQRKPSPIFGYEPDCAMSLWHGKEKAEGERERRRENEREWAREVQRTAVQTRLQVLDSRIHGKLSSFRPEISEIDKGAKGWREGVILTPPARVTSGLDP
jgi:hypothetical protein